MALSITMCTILTNITVHPGMNHVGCTVTLRNVIQGWCNHLKPWQTGPIYDVDLES